MNQSDVAIRMIADASRRAKEAGCDAEHLMVACLMTASILAQQVSSLTLEETISVLRETWRDVDHAWKVGGDRPAPASKVKPS